jgi:HEPN domain-containing protein
MELLAQYEFWLNAAKEDLQTSFDMLIIKRYNWALFVGHLAIDKLLKAKFILKFEVQPPKTHNLLLLIDKLEIMLDNDTKLLLMTINKFNIEARYEEYKRDFEKICTPDYTINYLNKIKEFFKWMTNY